MTPNSHLHHFFSPNHFNVFHNHSHRNASTSALDLDNETNCSGDSMARKNKEKNHNVLNCNRMCGFDVQSNKSKACNSNSNAHRAKPAKNIYYIRDCNDLNEAKVFIVDPRFHKSRKFALQKSLEDIRLHNSHVSQHYHHDTCIGNGMINRNVKTYNTLPRDFSRPKCRYSRAGLGNFFDAFHDDAKSGERR